MEPQSDKRLIDRTDRKGGVPGSEPSESLPDLASRVRQVSDDELSELKEQLVAEQQVRSERVQQRLSEDRSIPPEPEMHAPIPESELE